MSGIEHTVYRVIKMKKQKWKVYAFWIALSEAVGAISGFLTRDGMKAYSAFVKKPPLTPPDIVFPIVWTILFALMGIGAARIWLTGPSKERSRAIAVFLLQLAVNFVWTIVFFGYHAFGAALAVIVLLWALILLMIVCFAKLDKTAAYLQIPYLLWVSFAAYLNAAVWILNK